MYAVFNIGHALINKKTDIDKNMTISGQFIKTKMFDTDEDSTTIFIRILVSSTFILEGTHKLFTSGGVEKFTKIGFTYPEFTATFVGSFETICGILVLVGLATRFAVIPLIIIMITAIVTTKIPQFYSKPVFDVLHAARLDVALLLAGTFLCIKGGGKFSVDEVLSKR